MNINEIFPVSAAKSSALFSRMERLGIKPSEIEESFQKGGGKGGQKINKTSNAVMLRHASSGLVVRCQHSRSRALNRFLALRQLVDLIEHRQSPGTSHLSNQWHLLRKQKDRRRRRAAQTRDRG